MKVSYIFSLTALAAALVLGSCAKENGATGTAADGTRTIAVSFAKPTKSVLGLDGLTPEFQRGDEIIISNGSKYEKAYIEFIDDRPVIKTSLTGTLTAVYPSFAAELDGTQIIGVKVPMAQTGKFADANIAMAKNISDKAIFQNQTAVLKFYVDASIGVGTLEIRSDKSPIADEGDCLSIHIKSNTTLDEDTDDPTHRLCYAAVLPGTFPQLTVTSYTKTQNQVQKIFSNVSLKPGNMANAFLPYYIKVNIGSDMAPVYQNWAYCNLGAFLPEEPGYYFSWGNTQGYVRYYDPYTENSDWVLPSGEPGPAGGFTEENYSYTKGAKLTGNIPAENDAATTAWGGKWRMPAVYEFEALCKLSPSWISYHEGAQKGISYGDLFIPAVGRGIGTNIDYNNEKGNYWSSTIGNDNTAGRLYFSDSYTRIENDYSRSQGYPIRPIYGDPVIEETGLEVEKYDEGMTL